LAGVSLTGFCPKCPLITIKKEYKGEELKALGQEDKVQNRAEPCNSASSVYAFECQTAALMPACQAVISNATTHSDT